MLAIKRTLSLLLVLLLIITLSLGLMSCGKKAELLSKYENVFENDEVQDLHKYLSDCLLEAEKIEKGKQEQFSDDLKKRVPLILTRLENIPLSNLTGHESKMMYQLSYLNLALAIPIGKDLSKEYEALVAGIPDFAFTKTPTPDNIKDIIDEYFE